MRNEFDKWSKEEQLKQIDIETDQLFDVQSAIERAIEKDSSENLIKAQRNVREGIDRLTRQNVLLKHNLGNQPLLATQQNTPSTSALPLLRRQESY